jgi:hypothetical protein
VCACVKKFAFRICIFCELHSWFPSIRQWIKIARDKWVLVNAEWRVSGCRYKRQPPDVDSPLSVGTDFKNKIDVFLLSTEWLFHSPWNGPVLWHLLLPCTYREEWSAVADTYWGNVSNCWLAGYDIVINLYIEEFKLCAQVSSQNLSLKLDFCILDTVGRNMCITFSIIVNL